MADSYSPYQASVFTNRRHELAVLQQAVEDLRQGHPQHIALFGLRRIGKTLLCREHVQRLLAQDQVIPVHMDFEDLCSSPEIFCQRYIGLTCFWALREPSSAVDAYLSASSLLRLARQRWPLSRARWEPCSASFPSRKLTTACS